MAFHLSTYNNSYSHEIFIESNMVGRQNLNSSLGSVTVGDYQERLLGPSTSYLIDSNYKFLPCGSSKYGGLQKLIMSWMNEPNNYDVTEWPEIEKELKDHRLKFSDDI